MSVKEKDIWEDMSERIRAGSTKLVKERRLSDRCRIYGYF